MYQSPHMRLWGSLNVRTKSKFRNYPLDPLITRKNYSGIFWNITPESVPVYSVSSSALLYYWAKVLINLFQGGSSKGGNVARRKFQSLDIDRKRMNSFDDTQEHIII